MVAQSRGKSKHKCIRSSFSPSHSYLLFPHTHTRHTTHTHHTHTFTNTYNRINTHISAWFQECDFDKYRQFWVKSPQRTGYLHEKITSHEFGATFTLVSPPQDIAQLNPAVDRLNSVHTTLPDDGIATGCYLQRNAHECMTHTSVYQYILQYKLAIIEHKETDTNFYCTTIYCAKM